MKDKKKEHLNDQTNTQETKKKWEKGVYTLQNLFF